jgi:hypothetical protein
MGNTVGTTSLATANFCDVHWRNDSNHLDKTNAYGARVIHCDIVPKNLNNMEQKFHLQICKGWSLLRIWALWFSIVQKIKLKNWVGNL